MRRLLLSMILLFTLIPAQAQQQGIHIEYWQVPWPHTRPRDPAVAQHGRIWFVGQGGNYAATFDTETRQFKRYDLPEGAGPHTVYITRDQQVWYAGNLAKHLGRIDADSGKITQVAMPEGALHDPHTLYEDSTGRLWFTSQWANQIGRLDRQTGKIELVDVPTDNARPYGIAIDKNDTAWVVLMGTNKLAKITPDMKLTEITLPREEARPRRIAITDHGIWYVDYADGYLGRYNSDTGRFKEWQRNGNVTGPYAMAVDAKNRIWFVETHPNPNVLVGFDPATETFFINQAIPGGPGSVRHMVYDTELNALWFGTDSNYLMRAQLPD